MKILAALSLAAVLTAGSLTTASAFVPAWMDGPEFSAVHEMQPGLERSHFDRCHGRTAGTAHESCGTDTGGPVGGLF